MILFGNKMDFKNLKADMDKEFPREVLETDKCDWCRDKKAIVTDGTYVYCSKKCKELFINNAIEAIENANQLNFNKE